MPQHLHRIAIDRNHQLQVTGQRLAQLQITQRRTNRILHAGVLQIGTDRLGLTRHIGIDEEATIRCQSWEPGVDMVAVGLAQLS